MTRFKDPAMQATYETCRRIAAERGGELFKYDGKFPRRGGGMSSAFWNGYDGQPTRYLRTSLAYAAWAAGRDHERAGR
jgi:hypothetical protein